MTLRPFCWGSVGRHWACKGHAAPWRRANTNCQPLLRALRALVAVWCPPGQVTTLCSASRTNASGPKKGVSTRGRRRYVDGHPAALRGTQGLQDLAIPANAIDRQRLDRMALRLLFGGQQRRGIPGLIAVPRQNIEGREQFAVGVQTAIEEIPIEIRPMFPTAGIRIDQTQDLIALVRIVPIRQD